MMQKPWEKIDKFSKTKYKKKKYNPNSDKTLCCTCVRVCSAVYCIIVHIKLNHNKQIYFVYSQYLFENALYTYLPVIKLTNK